MLISFSHQVGKVKTCDNLFWTLMYWLKAYIYISYSLVHATVQKTQGSPCQLHAIEKVLFYLMVMVAIYLYFIFSRAV